MKPLLAVLSFLLFVPADASGVACLPGTLQNYIDLGSTGCSLGAIDLADFYVAPGQTFATPIDPAAIQVSPFTTGFGPSLLLTFASSASTGELLEAFFHFSGSAAGVLDVRIAMSGASAMGDGAVTATQDVCPDGTFAPLVPVLCPNPALTLITFATEFDALAVETADAGSAAFLDVFTDVVVDGGLAGSSDLDTVTLSFKLVPEPALAWLLAVGLAALAVVRRRGRG